MNKTLSRRLTAAYYWKDFNYCKMYTIYKKVKYFGCYSGLHCIPSIVPLFSAWTLHCSNFGLLYWLLLVLIPVCFLYNSCLLCFGLLFLAFPVFSCNLSVWLLLSVFITLDFSYFTLSISLLCLAFAFTSCLEFVLILLSRVSIASCLLFHSYL